VSTDGLIGVREAALLLGVHENTVRNWAKSGYLVPEAVLPTRGKRFSHAEIDRIRALMAQDRENRLVTGNVTVGVLVVLRPPAGMTPEQAVAEVRKGIEFGSPQVHLQYVLPDARREQ
jgi:Helix-turn-helix domain